MGVKGGGKIYQGHHHIYFLTQPLLRPPDKGTNQPPLVQATFLGPPGIVGTAEGFLFRLRLGAWG